MWCCSFSSFTIAIELVALLILFPGSTYQHAQNKSMDPLELETLFKIMDTLSSDANWRVSHPNPCQPGSSWPGLDCKTTQHVTRLDVGIPPNPTCRKSASFPPELFLLPHLESLFIFKCFTQSPARISLPPHPSSLLQQLSLRSNPSLVGPIPPTLSSIASLRILTLSQNGLSGPIPLGLLALPSLLHVDLSYNQLAGPIPAAVGGLRSLVGLDLSYNRLTGPIPVSIGRLGALQKVDLSSNLLTGGIPPTIGGLRSLNFLALSGNRLRGGFPSGVGKLLNLQYFLMDDNPMFVSLPEELSRLAKLQELSLSGSGYSGPIPNSYSGLANLTSLSLQNNRLWGPIPPGFAGMSRIYHLNLSGNSLRGVVPFDSGFVKRLGRNLDLSGNPGLCLNGTRVNNVINIGVDVCGNNKTGPVIFKPLRKSNAKMNRAARYLFLVGVVLLLQSFGS
ncbi:leucine-rich repeat receptor-like protein kinase family protein [Striga asiatica]|uniref:Leucine-rich repeat receptor-like protein kinase family protein n=1 Tax=Striga asiatica TaxID=4170 RepID=A0A5A7RGX8_STRAF|nr:leucine-rich repeat receptor-like protein kinase family protein [Striga asiatica]